MVVTFQVQLDNYDIETNEDKDIPLEDLWNIEAEFFTFLSKLEKFKIYIRGEMYLDEKKWINSCQKWKP